MSVNMVKRHQPQVGKTGFTLVEVLIAVVIFVIAIFAVLKQVNQIMAMVKSMQQQRPDLGTLAGKTMLEPPLPDGTLESGLSTPEDEDFGGNMGGNFAL